MNPIARKESRYGYQVVEVCRHGSDYVLYVGGNIKAISKDFNYIMSEYDKY